GADVTLAPALAPAPGPAARPRSVPFRSRTRRPPRSTLFPYTTLFRSLMATAGAEPAGTVVVGDTEVDFEFGRAAGCRVVLLPGGDRKSTRLNSSHLGISYAVFCLKKKNNEPDMSGLGPAARLRPVHVA